jgi:stearoyl-CoA desaturase (delta-9 desaturase)
MTDFQRDVLTPALREEATTSPEGKRRSLLPRKLRKGLADDGRWLKPDARQQMQAWVAQRPRIRALIEHRARLSAVLEARSQNAAETLHALQAWCHEAEASGIRALQEFSARLKGYSLVRA